MAATLAHVARRHVARRHTCPHRVAVRTVVPLLLGVVVLSVVCAPAGAQRRATGGPNSAPQPGPTTWAPPVQAPVADPFRPPPTPYAAGNRGLDYATDEGTVVRAAAAGTVVFAGPVAGALHVTVQHADGYRSSYSFLASASVGVGQGVELGDAVGTAGTRFHFGVRDLSDTYVDPASLFAGPRRAVLLPGGDDGAPRPRSALGEVLALADVVHDGLQRWGVPVPGVAVGASLLESLGPVAMAHLWMQRSPVLHLWRVVDHVAAHWEGNRACTPAEGSPPPPPAPGDRVVVLVGGFGSTSESAAADDVDWAALGYAPDDVVRFSYRGGRTPPPPGADGPLADVASSAYDAHESQGDLHVAGDRLADLLDEVARARPGVPIDVIAHSQGGIVTRLALADAEAEGGIPPGVDVVATLGTPHGGADLATVAAAVAGGPAGDAPLEALWWLGAPVDPDQPATAQLAEVSPVIDELRRTGIPDGVRFLSIGARGDLTVPAPRTVVPGAPHVVAPLVGPSAHDRLPGSPEATRELALAIGGLPPTCESFGDALLDGLAGESISGFEDELGWWAGTLAISLPGPGG